MHKKVWQELEPTRKARCALSHMFEQELSLCGSNANEDAMGKVSDMIKDLAEAEEKAMKACYYMEVIEAMEEYEDHEEGAYGYPGMPKRIYSHGSYGYDPMYKRDDPSYDDYRMEPYGYDHYRYSSGRFAPKGHGHYSAGYVPRFMSEDMRYGTAYNDWREAKKHYTATNTSTDREEMERKAREHVANMMVSFKEIWKTADPEARKSMKSDLNALVTELAADVK